MCLFLCPHVCSPCSFITNLHAQLSFFFALQFVHTYPVWSWTLQSAPAVGVESISAAVQPDIHWRWRWALHSDAHGSFPVSRLGAGVPQSSPATKFAITRSIKHNQETGSQENKFFIMLLEFLDQSNTCLYWIQRTSQQRNSARSHLLEGAPSTWKPLLHLNLHLVPTSASPEPQLLDVEVACFTTGAPEHFTRQCELGSDHKPSASQVITWSLPEHHGFSDNHKRIFSGLHKAEWKRTTLENKCPPAIDLPIRLAGGLHSNLHRLPRSVPSGQSILAYMISGIPQSTAAQRRLPPIQFPPAHTTWLV